MKCVIILLFVLGISLFGFNNVFADHTTPTTDIIEFFVNSPDGGNGIFEFGLIGGLNNNVNSTVSVDTSISNYSVGIAVVPGQGVMKPISAPNDFIMQSFDCDDNGIPSLSGIDIATRQPGDNGLNGFRYSLTNTNGTGNNNNIVNAICTLDVNYILPPPTLTLVKIIPDYAPTNNEFTFFINDGSHILTKTINPNSDIYSETFTLIPNLEHTISESNSMPLGFEFDRITCVDGNADFITHPFTPQDGDAILCAIHNNYTGTPIESTNDIEFNFNEQTKDMTIKWDFGDDRLQCGTFTEVFINDVYYFYDGLDFPIELKQNGTGSFIPINCTGEITQNFSDYSNDEILNFEMDMIFGTGNEPLGEIIFSYTKDGYYDRIECFGDDDIFDFTFIDYYEDVLGTFATKTDENGCNVILDITKSQIIKIEIPITQSSDDAEEYFRGGGVNLDKNYLNIGDSLVGLKFNNIPIDSSDVIKRAYIQFTVSDSTDYDVIVFIDGEFNAEPLTFENTTNNISIRNYTDEEVEWEIPIWSNIDESGINQQTPDLSLIMYEIMDYTDWKKGNSMVFLINYDNDGRYTHSFDSLYNQGVPKLILEIIVPQDNTSNPTDTKSGGSGDNKWKTKPTFGLSHATFKPLVDCGFKMDDVCYDITDNWHTDFNMTKIDVGSTVTFTLKGFFQNTMKVMAFDLGIPQVGESYKAEFEIASYYNYQGNMTEYKIIQDSNIVDPDTIMINSTMAKCQSSDKTEKCNEVSYTMTFLEPLLHNVSSMQGIDQKNRSHTTYLNEGFDVNGKSLNPMVSYNVQTNVKYEGLVVCTLQSKYSNICTTDDGREFEKNSYDTFREINQTFERKTTPEQSVMTRIHSEYYVLVDIEKIKAQKTLDEICPHCNDESFDKLHNIVYGDISKRLDRIDDLELQRIIILEQNRAQIILDNSN